jgi:hypothetical protein
MALIDQQEAAKLIRQNKDTHEDCQGAIHYNRGCEHSAQIVEQMNGQEIIYCNDCEHWDTSWETVYGLHYCPMIDMATKKDFFCKYGA